MSWPAFWVTPSGDAFLTLRRFTFGDEKPCPAHAGDKYVYGHDASSAPVDRRPVLYREFEDRDRRSIALVEPGEFDGHPAWPTSCSDCDYRFEPDDRPQVNQEPIWRTEDGSEWGQHSLPAGALFDAWWAPATWRGPDGLSLAIVLPDLCQHEHKYRADSHFWIIDSEAASGGRWTRTGDPHDLPTLSATPSILGGGSCYHGYLTNGVLIDPV